MNLQQFKDLILSTFIDKNNMVKPRDSFTDSGNGLVYSAIYIMMCQDLGGSVDLPTVWWFNEIVGKCMYKPGCLMRTPVNSFGQESWDDYLGVLMVCIYLGQTHIAREILWYGIKHAFFFCNGPFTKAGFIGRFPQVLTLMFIASFPILKYPMYPLMFIIGFFFMDPPVQDDQSGIELQWVFQSTMRKLYGNLSTYKLWNGDATKIKSRSDYLSDAFSRYYGTNHPFYLYGVANGL